MEINFITKNMPIFRQNNYIPPKENKGLRNLEHLHCALCGTEMMLKKTKDDILNELISEADETLPSSKSIKVFRKTIPFLPVEETNVVILMSKYANKYPDKTFEEIFKMPEVTTPLLAMKERKENDYRKKVSRVFKQIEKVLPNLSDEEIEKLWIFKERLIFNGFSRKSLEVKKHKTKEILTEFIKEMGIDNPKTIKTIYVTGDKIPYQKPNEIKLLCEYFGRKDIQILRSLLRNHLITIRHFGEEPHTNPSEMICLCERCNTETGNMSLKSMFKEFQNMPVNIRKYAEDIIHNILSGNISISTDYSEKFARFLREKANISINIPSVKAIKKEMFLKKYPKVQEVLLKPEPISIQNTRINQVETRIRELKKQKAEKTKIDEYRFLLELYIEKRQRIIEKY